MSVILIGPMGAGKSTLGKVLAESLGLRFVDLDEEIVAWAGMSIPDIFSRQGEDAFRRKEAEGLKRFVGSDVVLATGGGAVLYECNRELLSQHPPVIWLDVPPEVQAERIGGDANRPLIAGSEPLTRARELDEIRRALYASCADLHVRTDQLTVEQAVDCILRFLSESGRE